MLPAVDEALAQLEDHRLAFAQLAERLLEFLAQDDLAGLVDRRFDVLVGNEVTVEGVLLVADGRFEGERFAGETEGLFDLLCRPVRTHRVGDLLPGGLFAVLLVEGTAYARELVDRFDHVDRDADRARLVGDCAVHGLTDPPGGVRGELETAPVVELLDCTDEALVAFLHQVKEAHASATILLRNGDHEAQVGLDQVLAGDLSILNDPLKLTLFAVRKGVVLLLEALLGKLALFDAAGQANLFLEGQQLYAANLLEVLTHRVAGGGAVARPGIGPLFELEPLLLGVKLLVVLLGLFIILAQGQLIIIFVGLGVVLPGNLQRGFIRVLVFDHDAFGAENSAQSFLFAAIAPHVEQGLENLGNRLGGNAALFAGPLQELLYYRLFTDRGHGGNL